MVRCLKLLKTDITAEDVLNSATYDSDLDHFSRLVSEILIVSPVTTAIREFS
jgi:hypothetical protein